LRFSLKKKLLNFFKFSYFENLWNFYTFSIFRVLALVRFPLKNRFLNSNLELRHAPWLMGSLFSIFKKVSKCFLYFQGYPLLLGSPNLIFIIKKTNAIIPVFITFLLFIIFFNVSTLISSLKPCSYIYLFNC
jgi:hypothetical protein